MGIPKIVVIDDCRLNLAIAREILESAGYEVRTAETGLEANRHIYDPRRPDLILIDVVMPLLNGDKKVQFIKEREASKDIPVLLMSHKSESELAVLSRKAGADGFIVKPLQRCTLLAGIRRFLG